MEKQIELDRKQRYIQAIMKHKRFLRDIYSAASSVAHGVAEKNAINTPIQGSETNIIEEAIINILEQFKKRKPEIENGTAGTRRIEF